MVSPPAKYGLRFLISGACVAFPPAKQTRVGAIDWQVGLCRWTSLGRLVIEVAVGLMIASVTSSILRGESWIEVTRWIPTLLLLLVFPRASGVQPTIDI